MFRATAIATILCAGLIFPACVSGEEKEPPRYQTDGNVAPVLEGIFQGWGGTDDYFVYVDVEQNGTHRVKCRITARTAGLKLQTSIAELYPPSSVDHAAAILIGNFEYFQNLPKKKGYRAVVAPLRDECMQFRILEPQSDSVAEVAPIATAPAGKDATAAVTETPSPADSPVMTNCGAVNEDVNAYIGRRVAFTAKFRGITNSVDSEGNSLQVISTFQCVEPNGFPVNPSGTPAGFAVEGDGGVAMANPFKVFKVSGTVRSALTGTVDINQKKVPGRRVPLLDDVRIAGLDGNEDQTAAADDRIVEAAAAGDENEVARMLRGGVHVDQKDESGVTALIAAASNGHHKVVQLLLDGGAVPDGKSDAGGTALLMAADGGHTEAVRALLAGGANPLSTSNNGSIVVAAQKGHAEVVDLLLATGAPVETQMPNGANALIYASAFGYMDIVEALIAAQSPLNTQTKDGRSALMFAAMGKHNDVVMALLDAGAETSLRNNKGATALHFAETGEIVLLLAAQGADVDAKNNVGDGPLHIAAFHGQLEVARALIESGASVDQPGANDTSPLNFASGKGHPQVVELLLSAGAPIDFRAIDGSTPLMLAAVFGHAEVFNRLLTAGAQFDLQSNDGRTALMLAAGQGHVGIVSELLQAGADTTLRDAEGDTAWDFAKASEIKALLPAPN